MDTPERDTRSHGLAVTTSTTASVTYKKTACSSIMKAIVAMTTAATSACSDGRVRKYPIAKSDNVDRLAYGTCQPISADVAICSDITERIAAARTPVCAPRTGTRSAQPK